MAFAMQRRWQRALPLVGVACLTTEPALAQASFLNHSSQPVFLVVVWSAQELAVSSGPIGGSLKASHSAAGVLAKFEIEPNGCL